MFTSNMAKLVFWSSKFDPSYPCVPTSGKFHLAIVACTKDLGPHLGSCKCYRRCHALSFFKKEMTLILQWLQWWNSFYMAILIVITTARSWSFNTFHIFPPGWRCICIYGPNLRQTFIVILHLLWESMVPPSDVEPTSHTSRGQVTRYPTT